MTDIYDTFLGQCTEAILHKLDANNVHVVIVPANCTGRLQPLDISVNKAAKEFVSKKFNSWYFNGDNNNQIPIKTVKC